MTDYYTRLGIDKNATLKEIKDAYKKRAPKCHPDKVQDKIEEFKNLVEAYDTLKDPDLRRVYDESLENPDDKKVPINAFNFWLVEEPDKYDHYNYLNQLFKLNGTDCLVPGHKLANRNILVIRLRYILDRWYSEVSALLAKYPTPNAEIQTQINKLSSNRKKLNHVYAIFYSCGIKKDLYDYFLGVHTSDEIRQIEQEVGGRDVLRQYISENPDMDSEPGIVALHEAHCLTPSNFKKVNQCTDQIMFVSLIGILGDLLEAGLLNQINFNCLMQHKQNIFKIGSGLNSIRLEGILTQEYFDIILRAGKKAQIIGCIIGDLAYLGLLNKVNWQPVVPKIPKINIWATNIWPKLLTMQKEGLLTEPLCAAFVWTGPQELNLLNLSIDQMFAHGLFLLTRDTEKAKTVMMLALKLKKDLKDFFEQQAHEQEMTKKQFKASFIQTLHSKNSDMSIHRAHWKVIVSNVLIAFTGLGLLAIGIKYLMHGHCFFEQTTREKQIKGIEKTAWLASP